MFQIHIEGIRVTTFVLVPGGWLGGWIWKKVIPLLEERGHRAQAVTLTGMGERIHVASRDLGVEPAIQDVLNVIECNDLNDFVLVGHSFGGKVAAAVADRAYRRFGLVLFLDAFRPKKVKTPQGDFSDEWQPALDGWKIPFTQEVRGSFGKDVLDADRE